MPKFGDFETGLDYYRTLMHEFTHSTGVKKRLGRDMSGKFGSKSYAKEELVAEFGAIFLSAHAGIIWYNQKNHAEYLKNWNNALTHIKDDNRFIMRAASKAQEAADFILNRDKEGIPAYQNSLKSEPVKKVDPEKKKHKPKKKPVAKKPNTNDLLAESKKAKLTAKNKSEFERGLKKLGFEIISYEVNQENPKNWERSYQLNYKDVTGLVLEMSVKPEGKEIEGEYRWNAIGVDAGSIVDYENFQQFYEEILTDFQEVFSKASIKEVEDLKKQYSKTIFKKKEPKTQLGLFGAKGRKKKGLNSPIIEANPYPIEKPVEAVATVSKKDPSILTEKVEELKKKPVPVTGNPNSLAARMQRNQNRVINYYQIDNLDIAKFLGNVEIKEKESVGISITAPQGAGKTRFAFQLIDAFAKNYKVGHASMEEHPDSGLYESKALEYLDPENLANIDAPDINSMSDINKLIINNDVIVIDSFEKLREIDKNIQVDQDFRKKYDGKLFIFIFQLTSDGKMRGGSKSQFDVDIVLETEKFDDYRENYIYPNKNRYNSIPTSDLKFNIYNRAMIRIEGKTEPEEDKEDPTNSRVENPKSGRLIATPVL